MKFMVSSLERPQNYPIYSMNSDLDSSILYNSDNDKDKIIVVEEKHKEIDSENITHESLWHLDFDGSVNRLGERAKVWIYNLENDHSKGHAFKLDFKCTDNMAEYEALVLGLQIVRKIGAKRVSIMGDSELIIKQVKGEYITNNPRLSCYRETILDFINCFLETDFVVIPRKKNMQAHSLASFSITCRLPF